MILIYIAFGVFFGIIFSSIVVSAIPSLTIKILELFRLYQPGTLKSETTNFISGDGYYRRGKVYIYRGEGVSERFDNGRVFGYLILIFVPVFFIASVFAYFIFGPGFN